MPCTVRPINMRVIYGIFIDKIIRDYFFILGITVNKKARHILYCTSPMFFIRILK